METRASHVLVGAFVLILVLAAIGFGVWLAKLKSGAQFAFYDVYFTGAVTGLEVGGKVRRQGIEVGTVAEIELVEREQSLQVRVTIEVPTAPAIKDDARASLERSLLTNLAFVQIEGGGEGAATLEIVSDPSAPRPEIDAYQARGVGEAIDLGAEVLRKVSVNLDQLLSADNKDRFNNIIANIDRLATGLVDPEGRAVKVVDGLIELVGDARRVAQSLDQAVNELRPLVADLRDTVGEVRAAGLIADLDDLVGTLDETAQAATLTALDVSDFVNDMGAPIEEFASSGLFELSRVLTDLRTLIAGLNRITGEIERSPRDFLFRDQSQGYQVEAQ